MLISSSCPASHLPELPNNSQQGCSHSVLKCTLLYKGHACFAIQKMTAYFTTWTLLRLSLTSLVVIASASSKCFTFKVPLVSPKIYSRFPTQIPSNLCLVEWFELEGTFKDHLVQTPCHGQRHISLDQDLQSPFLHDLEHFQWGPTNLIVNKISSLRPK